MMLTMQSCLCAPVSPSAYRRNKDGGSAANDDTYGADGLQGFTRDGATHEFDGAEVDDNIVADDEEDSHNKSEEPDDGESLDDRIDE